ncbi:hypothetical protein [Allosphingosinicella deserti]|uniref:Uncharacterized protein n=1 Tax=Allosphingosinicella deserti TaxID=2116704 RepID=A0A2P7QRA2_9SPHN|nr:hypothetical protein [Sphingomonas deserti]PSJ40474.1 hypothetical protein C7I55_09050 [Sphingomonas deserti]
MSDAAIMSQGCGETPRAFDGVLSASQRFVGGTARMLGTAPCPVDGRDRAHILCVAPKRQKGKSMPADPEDGFFASMLRARMREHEMDLEDTAFDFLRNMERDFTEERRQRGLPREPEVSDQLRYEAEMAV